MFRHAADLLKTRGGPGRNQDLLIEVAVARLAAQHETYLLTGISKSSTVPTVAFFGSNQLGYWLDSATFFSPKYLVKTFLVGEKDVKCVVFQNICYLFITCLRFSMKNFTFFK